jgi:hypothetical protein
MSSNGLKDSKWSVTSLMMLQGVGGFQLLEAWKQLQNSVNW